MRDPYIFKFIELTYGMFHPECFRCRDCNQPITGSYGEKNGTGPYCETCVGGISDTQKVQISLLNKGRRGFTVDPRSGQKKYSKN
jgi:hypothetical protein